MEGFRLTIEQADAYLRAHVAYPEDWIISKVLNYPSLRGIRRDETASWRAIVDLANGLLIESWTSGVHLEHVLASDCDKLIKSQEPPE